MKLQMQSAVGVIVTLACGFLQAMTLTQDGQPAAVVVLPKSPRPIERYAAEELVRFVKKASGAQLRICQAPVKGLDTVLIGRAAGIVGCAPFCGAVEADEHTLKIAGGDNDSPVNSAICGTLFAVYEFLERELKVLWLWPDEQYGIVVRPRKDIVVPMGRYGWRSPFENVQLRRLPLNWKRRVARSHGGADAVHAPDLLGGGHAFSRWWKTYGKSNPDFFEMNAHGERVIGGASSMCVSNPEFHRELKRLWREARAAHPERRYFMPLAENDTDGRCKCPTCRAWANPGARENDASGRYGRFYKAIYDLISPDDPDIRLTGLAYKNYNTAPAGVRLPENVWISFVPHCYVPYTPDFRKEVHDTARSWRESGCTFNYRPNLFDGYVMPFDISDDIFDEFHQVYSPRMKSYDVDGPNLSYAMQGPFLYLIARWGVHPEAKLEDVRREFFSGFGPAAEAVGEYFDYWRTYVLANVEKFCRTPREKDPLLHDMFFGWHFAFYAHLLYPQEVFGPAEALLRKAQAQAAESPDDLARVNFLVAGLEHARLCAETCAVFADAKRTAERCVAAVRRVREFRETQLPKWAADLQQATAFGKNEAAAWQMPELDPDQTVALPIDWKFKLDTAEKGEGLGYSARDFDVSAWTTAKTDRHLEKQGYEKGWLHAWFALDTVVPERFRGAPKAILRFGAIDKTCKVWVNGKLVGQFTFNPETHPNSWNLPMEYDISKFVPDDGRLRVTVKLSSPVGAGGILRGVFLVFPDAGDLKYEFSPSKPLRPDAFFSFGTTCCRKEGDLLLFDGGEKPTSGCLPLKQLKNPGSKLLRLRVDCRTKGTGCLDFVLWQKDYSGKVRSKSTMTIGPSDGFAVQEKEFALAGDVKSLELRFRNALQTGEKAEVRALSVELLPLLSDK